jgi:hypothetical protein
VDTYGEYQDHKADATNSQQTGEPGPVPRYKFRGSEAQSGHTEDKVHEPFEQSFPKRDGFDEEVAPNQHEDFLDAPDANVHPKSTPRSPPLLGTGSKRRLSGG